jgi:hypothetical protein
MQPGLRAAVKGVATRSSCRLGAAVVLLLPAVHGSIKEGSSTMDNSPAWLPLRAPRAISSCPCSLRTRRLILVHHALSSNASVPKLQQHTYQLAAGLLTLHRGHCRHKSAPGMELLNFLLDQLLVAGLPLLPC